MIWAIDPGTHQSAYVALEADLNPQNGEFAILPNDELLSKIAWMSENSDELVIEMLACYGMPVGEEVLETAVWIGRFIEVARRKGIKARLIKRIEVKNHLCHSSRAKDANVRQALIDRFGIVGTKKNPGWFYGFRADIWAAYAVAVTHVDNAELAVNSRVV